MNTQCTSNKNGKNCRRKRLSSEKLGVYWLQTRKEGQQSRKMALSWHWPPCSIICIFNEPVEKGHPGLRMIYYDLVSSGWSFQCLQYLSNHHWLNSHTAWLKGQTGKCCEWIWVEVALHSGSHQQARAHNEVRLFTDRYIHKSITFGFWDN